MELEYKPIGGFPSIIRIIDDKINTQTFESRGFSNNIVSINDVINAKKKDLFLAFGSDDEEMGGGLFDNEPDEFESFSNE